MSEENQLTETTNTAMADEFDRQFANFMRNSFAMNKSNTDPPEKPAQPYKIDTQPLDIGGNKLNGENYSLWSVLMKTAISGRGMVSHVTGVPPSPPRTDPAFAQWQQADHCVFTWLIQNIEPRLVSRISQHPTAKHIWDALAVTYGSGGDRIQVYDLQFKASTLRQGHSSLDEIWSRLQEIWISIDQKQKNPMKYQEDIEIHDKFIQDQRLCQFVYAIDSKYESTKREILKLNPLPSVDFAYNLVQQEETRLQVLQPANTSGAVTTEGIGAGLAVRGWQNHAGGSRGGGRAGNYRNRRSDEEDKSKLVCSYYKRKKHTKDSCFELIGYPEWWEEKHGKPPPPPSRAAWNRGGHAAVAVGGDRGTAVHGGQETAQIGAAAQPTKRAYAAAVQPASTIGAANFVAEGSGSIVNDWSGELLGEEGAAHLSGKKGFGGSFIRDPQSLQKWQNIPHQNIQPQLAPKSLKNSINAQILLQNKFQPLEKLGFACSVSNSQKKMTNGYLTVEQPIQ